METAEAYEAELQRADDEAAMEAAAHQELMADRELRLKSALRECALMGVSIDSLRTLVFESGSRYDPLRDAVWSSYETEWHLWD